jgi:hypothetical protein
MVFDTAQAGDITYSISFQTMMNYLNQYGIASRGYKMNWKTLKDTLEKDYAPIIINYDKPTPHFALLLHIGDGYVCRHGHFQMFSVSFPLLRIIPVMPIL